MKAALSVFLRWMIEMRPAFDSSASRRSVIAISVGHFRSTPPSSVGKVWVGRLITSPPDCDAADAHRPAVFLEGAVDVGRHRVGGVHPGVFLALVAVGLLLEGEFLDRLRLGAVGQARQHARHAQRDVAAVDRVAQALPGRVVRRVHQLADVARVHQLGPGVHAEQVRIRAGDQRRERRRGDLREVAQQLHVGRRVAEVIVGDQRAVGLAAELCRTRSRRPP